VSTFLTFEVLQISSLRGDSGGERYESLSEAGKKQISYVHDSAGWSLAAAVCKVGIIGRFSNNQQVFISVAIRPIDENEPVIIKILNYLCSLTV
jgi:hypothetical protein